MSKKIDMAEKALSAWIAYQMCLKSETPETLAKKVLCSANTIRADVRGDTSIPFTRLSRYMIAFGIDPLIVPNMLVDAGKPKPEEPTRLLQRKGA